MKLLLHLFLGCSEFEIPYTYLKDVLNFLNSNNIPMLNLCIKEKTVVLRVWKKYEEIISAFLLNICCGNFLLYRRGLPKFIKKYSHRTGLIAGLLMFFVCLCVSPLFIWQINISGLDKLSHGEVREILEDVGVKVGTFSPLLNRSEIYSKVLLANEEISWISVNIQGSTANVEIVERDTVNALKNKTDGANIIALKAGQILDAEIIKGRRAVKNGDIVGKGDLLVSGVYDSTKMGTRFVHADAVVIAKVFDEYFYEVPLSYPAKLYAEEILTELSVKIFENEINILKNYSKIGDNYDIIEKENVFTDLGFDRLPITVKTVVALPFDLTFEPLSVEKALEIARQTSNTEISNATYIELLGKEESFYVENNTLYFSCRVEAVQNIALVNEFTIN